YMYVSVRDKTTNEGLDKFDKDHHLNILRTSIVVRGVHDSSYDDMVHIRGHGRPARHIRLVALGLDGVVRYLMESVNRPLKATTKQSRELVQAVVEDSGKWISLGVDAQTTRRLPR